MKQFVTVLICNLFLLAPCFAEFNTLGVPDSSEIRQELEEQWFSSSLDELRQMNVLQRTNNLGTEFQVRLEETDEHFILYVSPKQIIKVTLYDNQGSRTEEEVSYLGDSFGSWILVRNKSDGSPVVIRYYFTKNNDVYIQFRPNKNISYADLVISGSYASRSVPVGVPFSTFYRASFADVLSLTKNAIPWKYVDINVSQYENSFVMIQTIRSLLNKVVFTEDAMYDENGLPVYIFKDEKRIVPEKNKDDLTLSSAGFVKWIVDGLVFPRTGGYYLPRSILLPQTVQYKENGFQGNLSKKYSISFSLDWTRNLAASSLAVRSKKNITYAHSGVDVTIEPFTAMLTKNGIVNSLGYIKNSGYRAEYLHPLLFVLAVTEPDYFYLAAIRQTDINANPEVKVFNECAVIFPYFESNGKFNAVVFINGKEEKLSDFIENVKSSNGDFIHLTRVRASEKYYPQE